MKMIDEREMQKKKKTDKKEQGRTETIVKG